MYENLKFSSQQQSGNTLEVVYMHSHSSGLCRVFLKQYNNKHWLGKIDGCLQNKCQCYLLELTIIFLLMFLSLFSFHQLFHQHIKLRHGGINPPFFSPLCRSFLKLFSEKPVPFLNLSLIHI